LTDIVLINPAASHGIYGPLGNTLVAVEPPTWLRLTAAYLRNKGHTVQVIDAEQLRSPAKHVAQMVEQADPRLVALVTFGHMPSAATQQMFGAREVATAIKAANSNRRIVILGGHVSALPERTLREEPVDYAVKGEGPITLDYLLGDFPINDVYLGYIPGLVWRTSHGEIVINSTAKPLDPSIDLVDQGWDFTPPVNYVAHNWQALDHDRRTPYASVVTSFNCPHRCSFCNIATPFGGPGYATRDPLAVVEEIEFLHHSHGVQLIKIVDEMFVLKPSHYLPIVDGLAARGLGDKINIWCYARVDTVRPETLARLRAGGVRWLALGIESGSAAVRDGADKRLRSDDIVGVVRAVQAAGINVIGNFMFGFRDDTEATMAQTLELALECLPEWANFYTTMALPGSRLYDQALAEGWTLPTEWRGYSQHNRYCRPLDTETISAQEVLRFRDQAFNAYFTDPAYLAMIGTKFGPAALAQVHKMTEYRLPRDLLGGVAA
jgi:anaerobic magnesium-protoporphyrin IX monomethyl ester cyclase